MSLDLAVLSFRTLDGAEQAFATTVSDDAVAALETVLAEAPPVSLDRGEKSAEHERRA